MHQSVRDAWHAFSTPLEGRTRVLYCDVKGLVTCAVGILVDSSPHAQPWLPALDLEWSLTDGTRASKDQVIEDWRKVKNGNLYLRGSEAQTKIRLTDEAIDKIVNKRLSQNEAHLRKVFTGWDGYPADAQLAILSMAWAVGAGLDIKFPRFTSFAQKQDWIAAKACSKLKEIGNPGVVPRNRHNELCFDNAETVRLCSMDASVLHWPKRAEMMVPAVPSAPMSGVPQIPLDRDRVAELEEVKDAVEKIT